VLFVVVLIGGSIYMFRTHVKGWRFVGQHRGGTGICSASATGSADSSRLVEFTEGRNDATTCRRCNRPRSDARRVQISHTLRVPSTTFSEGRLIHGDIPGWVLRMMLMAGAGL